MAKKYWVANNPNSEITDTKAQKLAELSATTVTLAELDSLDADATTATITLSAASVADGGTIECAIQFKDAAGVALTYPVAFDFYISSLSTGLDLDSAATGITDGGAGHIIVEYVAQQSGKAVTNAVGLCDIDVVDAGADVLYLVVVMPNDGRLIVSTSMTYAA